MRKKLTILLTTLSVCMIAGCSNQPAKNTEQTTRAVIEETEKAAETEEAELPTVSFTDEEIERLEKEQREKETEKIELTNSQLNAITDEEWMAQREAEREQRNLEREQRREERKKAKEEKTNNEKVDKPEKDKAKLEEEEEGEIYEKKIPSVELANIDGEFSKIKINDKELKFGNTTITDILYNLDEDVENEETNYYGIRTFSNENGFDAYALTVEDEIDIIYGISVDTENYEISDEYKTLTSIKELLGEETNLSESVYEWNNESIFAKAETEEDNVKNFTLINKDVINENLDIFHDYLKKEKWDLNDYTYESMNNLETNIDELTAINLAGVKLEIGKTVIDDEIMAKLAEEFGNNSTRGKNYMVINTFENGLILRGLMIEDCINCDHNDYILMSIGFRQNNDNTLKNPIAGLEKTAIELSEKGGDVWQNDTYEINFIKEDNKIKDVSISLLEYSVSEANFKSSIYKKAYDKYLNMDTNDFIDLLIERTN